MSRKKQKIKIVLHTPSEMDADRQRQVEEFEVEKMVALIEKLNPNEHERKYLKVQIKKKLIEKL
ncbi:hypothetical protein AALA13_08405 [Lachnospiraceae bacterium 50-23]